MDTHLSIYLYVCEYKKEKFPTSNWSLELLIAQQAKMDLGFWFCCCCEGVNNIDNVLVQNFL